MSGRSEIEGLQQLSLTPMRPKDIPDVLEIEKVSFSNSWRSQDFEYALNKAEGICRVCREAGVLLGYTVGFLVETELHLSDFAVHPAKQRRGYGSTILKLFLAQLIDQDVKVVTLEVRRSNARAVGMYSKAGFQTVAIRDDYYSRPVEDAFVMLKTLDGTLSDWLPGWPISTAKTGESS